MGIYGHRFDNVLSENSYSSISCDEMKDILFEMYASCIDHMSEDTDVEIVEEGANLDIRAEWKQAKKMYKKYINAYKVYANKKEFDRASGELDKAYNVVKKARDQMAKIDADDVGSAILGFFATTIFLDFVECWIPFTISVVGNTVGTSISVNAFDKLLSGEVAAEKVFKSLEVGGKIANGAGKIAKIIQIIQKCIIIYKDVKTLTSEIKKNGNKITVKDFNIYRTRLLRYMDDMLASVAKLKENLKTLKEKENSK